MFDGEEYVICTEALKSDLIGLCEDNEVMKEAIKDYFEDKEALGKWIIRGDVIGYLEWLEYCIMRKLWFIHRKPWDNW